MNIENGIDSSRPSKLDKITQAEFNRGSKLTAHVFNKWRNAGAWFALTGKFKEQAGPLEPLKHYKEIIKEHFQEEGQADEVMAKSNREAVAAFDELVDDFNNHLDEIVQKGIDEAEKYLQRARTLEKQSCQ